MRKHLGIKSLSLNVTTTTAAAIALSSSLASLLANCGPSLIGGSTTTTNTNTLTISTAAGATGGGAYAPGAFSISTSGTLAAVSSVAAPTQSGAGSALVTSSAPFPIADTNNGGTNPAVAGGSADTALGSSSVSSPAVASGSGAAGTLLSTTFSATITYSPAPAFPSGATGACSAISPFTSTVSCSLASFTVDQSMLTSSGSLLLKAYASNGGSTDYTNSTNSIPITYYSYRQVTNIAGSGATDNINSLLTNNGKLYILTGGGTGTDGIYVYDGSTLVRKTTDWAAKAQAAILYNSKIFYSSGGGSDHLARYDDSTGVTTQITNILAGGGETFINMAVYNVGGTDKLYFSAVDHSGSSAYKLFEYNDFAQTLTRVSNTNGGLDANTDFDATGPEAGETPLAATVGGSSGLYLPMQSSNAPNYWLYKWDGASLTKASKLYGAGNDTPKRLTSFNNKLYFFAHAGLAGDAGLYKLHSFDGTTFKQIASTNPGSDDTAGGTQITSYNNRIFFVSYDSSGHYRLFRYDETANKVAQITNIVPTGTEFFDGSAQGTTYFQVYNNKLFFIAQTNTSHFWKLFSYDDTGTSASAVGTLKQISNTAGAAITDFSYTGNCGAVGVCSPHFIVYNNKLYFIANNSSTKPKLYVYDDTTGVLNQVMDVRGSGVADFDWGNLVLPVIFSNRLAIVGSDASLATKSKVFTICDPNAGCTGP